ncbi:uncharacterized protein LOC115006205 [Cottoperca gobio]|uniref:Uncharacterized protein LOC115006205 n=1 Tax=Cottoperca gobio TaxID=56716 RepID=A0A6J2PFP5_COTGO|nr:uncharacterized protein LOC115006205 [Cottoperca gobio]
MEIGRVSLTPEERRRRLASNLCLYCGGEGLSRLSPRTQLIHAVEGDDVTFQCFLDPPVNLSTRAVECNTIKNKVVHFSRGAWDDPGAPSDEYRNRVTLNHGYLSRGVVTLHISLVNLSDNETYRCFVPKLTAVSFTSVCCLDESTEHILSFLFQTGAKDQPDRTERKDSSPTGPPVEDDATNRKADRAVIVLTVFLTIFCAVLVFLFLKKYLMAKRRERKEQKLDLEANGCEMKQLNTCRAGGEEDLERNDSCSSHQQSDSRLPPTKDFIEQN